METESGVVAASAEQGGDAELLLNGYRVSD